MVDDRQMCRIGCRVKIPWASHDEHYLMQLLAENAPAGGPLREVVQNILDERIPLEERLPKPLLPGKYPPKAPPRQRRGIKR